jgi:2-amino-4-hydroxy-6-hydroxymethyldihydropteridine diphosphokinase
MKKIYVGIGSNINSKYHIKFAVSALRYQFLVTEISPCFVSEAVGFIGENFINLVVAIKTSLTVAKISKILLSIEDSTGRDRTKPKFSSRTLDLDILSYGNVVGEVDGIKLPRDEILTQAHVLLPLSLIATYDTHPISKKTYKEHWQAFNKKVEIRQITLDLNQTI